MVANTDSEDADRSKTTSKPKLQVTGLVAAFGFLGCVATVIGFAGSLWWFFDLFANFRVQYFCGLLIIGLYLLYQKQRKTAAVIAGFAVVNLMAILPLFFGGNRVEDPSPTRVMLLNVNTQLGDVKRIRAFIEKADPDVVVLQEINEQWVRDLSWLEESHPQFITKARSDNFGIGLYSRLPTENMRIEIIGKALVPSITATSQIDGIDVRLIATHPLPPTSQRNSELRDEQLAAVAKTVPAAGAVLLIGDLNATRWSHAFRKLVAGTRLHDSARGFGIQSTWPDNILPLRIAIDQCLHSSEIAITDRWVGPDVGSDHFPLVLDFGVVSDE